MTDSIYDIKPLVVEFLAVDQSKIRLLAKQIVVEEAQRAFLKPAVLLSTSRWRDAARARQAAIWRMRDELGMSSAAIARLMNRDHTTILYSIRKEQARRDQAICPIS